MIPKCYECGKEVLDADNEAADYAETDILCEVCASIITVTGGGNIILSRKEE